MLLFIHLSYVQEILIGALVVLHPCTRGFRGHEEGFCFHPFFRGSQEALKHNCATIRTQFLQSHLLAFSWAKLNAAENTIPVCISGNEVCFSLDRLKALKRKEKKNKKGKKGKEVSLSVSSGNIIKIYKYFVYIGLEECSSARKQDGHTSIQNQKTFLLLQTAKTYWNCEMAWWSPEFPYLWSTHSRLVSTCNAVNTCTSAV